MNVLDDFHPAVANWFRNTFDAPTEPQARAWPAIRSGSDVLIAAPTGSGKTLAAFLAAIDALVRLGVTRGLGDEIRVVYVSPLKALSNDIHKNLEEPLAGIRKELTAQGHPDVEIRTLVRTGDTPQAERERMRRKPPHILVTTPESLYILLTSESGRKALATVRTVIVDEIHALAPNKRGAHLALSLERLEHIAGTRLVRVGLSATQKPIDEVASFLTGGASRPAGGLFDGTATGYACATIDTGHARKRDLALEVPEAPLEAVMSAEVWEQMYDRLAELIREHRSTLVFVNTRRLAERAARALTERLGEGEVTSHHGSLAREQRLNAEGRLKRGELKALVATSSLELGIDIGHVDLVCQLGTPRAISALLQRVGRSGHAVGGLPKGRLFPLSRDDLVECAALLDAVRRGELDCLRIPRKPLDVLAQQIAAEVACGEWDEDALFDCFRRAWPYRGLAREEYGAVVQMLSEGYSTRRGRSRAVLHRDAVNRRLRPRQGLRLTAITCGGTIPDTADYSVVLAPEEQVIGTVNEDFAVESMAGDIFQLGNTSYRILRVEAGRVRVEDAAGLPPSIPFWLGEAPVRTDEVSAAVSRLRADLEARLNDAQAALAYLTDEVGIAAEAAQQIVEYLAAAKAVLGLLPTQQHLVFERFFDESGGAQLVIHSPYGNRVNRAWGLALRKRFCRKFNFELQAAATEDAIILSLTSSHSFPLEEVARYLHASTARDVLTQALLDAPMFMTRWRWNAVIAFALLRYRGGGKVAPQLQRMEAEDLVAAIFPDQLACQENIAGDREIPDHPLVNQTLSDCLHEAMDVEGLERLLSRLGAGEVRVTARELVEPSPLAQEILAARPYAFLDDAPLEERRTQAVASRRWLDPESAADIGRLDAEAIARVKEEAWPSADSADELHDALAWLGLLMPEEVAAQPGWAGLLQELARQSRAARFVPAEGAGGFWIAAERLPDFQATHRGARLEPEIVAPPEFAQGRTREEALAEIVRGRLEELGPATAGALAAAIAVPVADVEQALVALESEGFAMRGSFTAGATGTEWCERRLLARIHRYTLKRLRKEIEPVAAADFMRFLFDWQRVAADERMEGPDALAAVASQLEGFEAAAAAWETALLPARVAGYEPAWLDDLCLAGRVAWTRLDAPQPAAARSQGPAPIRSTPVTLITRRNLPVWTALVKPASAEDLRLSSRAQAVADCLSRQGASFFDDIVEALDQPRTFVEDALRELVAAGLVNSDGFSGLRALLLPADRRKAVAGGRRRRTALFGVEDAGRWALIRRRPAADAVKALPREVVEQVARTLLRRYGVVFWRLLAREAEWLPPWRELLMACRRLEARGEIRGGRFVAGFSGEQFALPEAVGVLRSVRNEEKAGRLTVVNGADPLNLAGVIVPGAKVPALHGNRVLYRDGVAIAALVAGEAQFFESVEPARAWELKNLLLRSPAPEGLAALM
ncbi:MAG: DEAD/DEAH box helicase [Betaproteobacteria bacterium]|nr:DEAD/DEAH box helicase [Betaproteobacteria bacterium]